MKFSINIADIKEIYIHVYSQPHCLEAVKRLKLEENEQI